MPDEPDPTTDEGALASSPRLLAEVLAALAYGEELGAKRAADIVALAPDQRSRTQQEHIAQLERHNWQLMQARVRELGGEGLIAQVKPYFDAFFTHTEPKDWIEAQTFHYVGDALVSDFADVLAPLADPVSREVVRRALGDRQDMETFALDELTRALENDEARGPEVADYARRVIGEALTQTARALEATEGLRTLLGGAEAGKHFVISLLERHRQRMDRLGVEPVESD
jgi:hypothetical protein